MKSHPYLRPSPTHPPTVDISEVVGLTTDFLHPLVECIVQDNVCIFE